MGLELVVWQVQVMWKARLYLDRGKGVHWLGIQTGSKLPGLDHGSHLPAAGFRRGSFAFTWLSFLICKMGKQTVFNSMHCCYNEMNEYPPTSQRGHTTHAGNGLLPLVQSWDGTQSSGDPRMEQLPATSQVPAGLPGLRALYSNQQNVSPESKRFPTTFYLICLPWKGF